MEAIKTILLTLIDPAKNTFKFYRLQLDELDDGQAELSRKWGRIGGKVLDDSERGPPAVLEAKYTRLVREKLRDGYTQSESDEIPDGKEAACSWCERAGPEPVKMDGCTAVPYPVHAPFRLQETTMRARWLAQVDKVAALMKDPTIVFPKGPHAVALLVGVAPEAAFRKGFLDRIELDTAKPEPDKKESPTTKAEQLGLFD